MRAAETLTVWWPEEPFLRLGVDSARYISLGEVPASWCFMDRHYSCGAEWFFRHKDRLWPLEAARGYRRRQPGEAT